jgi:alpha-L-fucosidase
MSERYEANWESLKGYSVPGWFKDAKLGIFIHWGVYAVPAFDNE